MPWVKDGIVTSEKDAVQELIYLAVQYALVFEKLMERAWVEDGLGEAEYQVVEDLRNIAWKSDDGTQALSGMPFLETIEAPDAVATTALRRLVYFDTEKFKQLLDHPAIRDGIDDREAKIVATLRKVVELNPALVDTLLDPEQVTLEERKIELPMAGEVLLTIIRTRPGAERTMSLLENAVRNSENLMAVPFPQKYVAYLLEDATSSPTVRGTNFGTHIASKPEVDEASYSVVSTRRHINHEVSHFYWTRSETWINEGAANLIEAVGESELSGEPVHPDNRPCAYAFNIVELETLDPERGSPEYNCHYRVGERLFHDLYRNLDGITFRQGFRNLYLMRQFDAPDDECAGTRLDICHVKAAFKSDVPAEVASTVDRVIARWHDGSEPYDISFLDSSPVDPSLPSSVKGDLTRAYIVLDEDRPDETRTEQFSVSEVQGWAYLYVHFSYVEIREEQEFPMTVVEYFEDGFSYNSQSRTTTFETGWTSSWYWTTIGGSATREWAPGRYWLNVYHEGQKMAEVDFQVTP